MRMGLAKGLVDYRPRHRVNELMKENSKVVGVRGDILIESSVVRGKPVHVKRLEILNSVPMLFW